MQKTAHRMTTAHRTYGFTLVEISVVFVIIGLIIGGIFMGNDMIKSSQLRGVLKDIEQFNAATNTFQEKYNALPGDMPNATDYWGANGGNTLPPLTAAGVNCGFTSTAGVNTATTATSTCNGDGDGNITSPITTYTFNEAIYFWRHLQDAGLISCNCSGQSYSNYGNSYPGFNAPLSPLGNGSGYSIRSAAYIVARGPAVGYFYQPAVTTGNYFTLGAATLTTNVLSPTITSADAYNLDLKIDDGIPSTGNVQSPMPIYGGSYAPLCSTSTTASAAKYNLANSGIICSLLFKASF